MNFEFEFEFEAWTVFTWKSYSMRALIKQNVFKNMWMISLFNHDQYHQWSQIQISETITGALVSEMNATYMCSFRFGSSFIKKLFLT